MGALVGHDAVHEPEVGQGVVVVEQVVDAVGELGVYETQGASEEVLKTFKYCGNA